MNEHSRQALETLAKNWTLVHKEWFTPKPPSYTAIAFDSYYPEWGNTREINIRVGIVRVNTEGGIECPPRPYELKIALEGAAGPRAKGASEPMGLVPKTFAYDQEKQGVIERNLADFLTAVLYDEIRDGNTSLVLFQGPFFPKLLGRLGYRHISRATTLAALTFKHEWFPFESGEPNRRLNERFANRFLINVEKSCDARTGDFHQLADSRPSNGLEEVLKAWGVGASGQTVLVLELFCQFSSTPQSSGQESPWVVGLKAVQQTLRFPGTVFEQGEAVWLPVALACAYDQCRRHGWASPREFELMKGGHWKYLGFYEEDVQTMYHTGWEAPEVVARRSLLYLGMHSARVYQSFAHALGLGRAHDPVARGMNLSQGIGQERASGAWTIERWRELLQ